MEEQRTRKDTAVRESPGRVSPLRAIRARCVECCETKAEVKACPFDGRHDEMCWLYPYRLGSDPFKSTSPKKAAPLAFWHVITSTGVKVAGEGDEAGTGSLRRQNHAPRGYLRAIHAHCVWCCADQPSEVRYCPSADCPLHEYRMGRRNPPQAPP